MHFCFKLNLMNEQFNKFGHGEEQLKVSVKINYWNMCRFGILSKFQNISRFSLFCGATLIVNIQQQQNNKRSDTDTIKARVCDFMNSESSGKLTTNLLYESHAFLISLTCRIKTVDTPNKKHNRLLVLIIKSICFFLHQNAFNSGFLIEFLLI